MVEQPVEVHAITTIGLPWNVGVSWGGGSELPAEGEVDEDEDKIEGTGVEERLPEPNPGREPIEDGPPML